MKAKIEIVFKDHEMAEKFAGDMLNLEAYGLKIGPVIPLNDDGTLFISASPKDYIGGAAGPSFVKFHNNVEHHAIVDKHVDLRNIPESDYPDGDEG